MPLVDVPQDFWTFFFETFFESIRLLQLFLLILSRFTFILDGQVFLQWDIVHSLGSAVVWLFRYRRVWVADHISGEGRVQADLSGACAPIGSAWNERSGARGRPRCRQVGLATGAVVVVKADHYGAVLIAATHHWAIPLKVQVPTCPCFLYLCLNLTELKRKKSKKSNSLKQFYTACSLRCGR